MLHEVGPPVLLERHIELGDDHATEITRLERAVERREEMLDADPDDEDLKRPITKMTARAKKLRDKPREPDKTDWREVKSSITVAKHWASLTPAERANFPRDWEVTVFADKKGWDLRLGIVEAYNEYFKLTGNRLAPANLPALIKDSQDWQQVDGAMLSAIVAQEIAK